MTVKQTINYNQHLVEGISNGALSKKHGFGKSTICMWVMESQGLFQKSPLGQSE